MWLVWLRPFLFVLRQLLPQFDHGCAGVAAVQSHVEVNHRTAKTATVPGEYIFVWCYDQAIMPFHGELSPSWYYFITLRA